MVLLKEQLHLPLLKKICLKIRDRMCLLSKPMDQKTHLNSKAVNSANMWILKNKFIEFLIPISYSALWKSTMSTDVSRTIILRQLALRQIQRAVRWALLCSACTNTFAEFSLSLPTKMNSVGPDDFTFQRTKLYKCSNRARAGWRVAKIAFLLWTEGGHWRIWFKTEDLFDLTVKQMWRQ